MTFVKIALFTLLAAVPVAFVAACIMLSVAANQYADAHVIVIP